MQVSVEYGEVSENGIQEINGREKTNIVQHKDITF